MPPTSFNARAGASWIKGALCLLLGVILFFWLNPYFLSHLAVRNTPIHKLFYIVVFLIAMASILSTVIASRLWATLALIFFAFNFLISATFTAVKDRPIALLDIQMLSEVGGNETGFWDAVTQFGPTFSKVALAVALLIALIIWARTFTRIRTSIPLFVFTFAFILAYGIRLAGRGDPAVLGLPSNFTTGLGESVLIMNHVVERVTRKPESELVFKRLPDGPTVRHIVLVIDESIEAEVFAAQFRGTQIDHMRDLGTAYSFANCSQASELMLRRGADPMDLERSLRHAPSLFQLAKTSGYTTAFVDAWDVMADWGGQNFFDEREKPFIDIVPPLKQFPVYDRDFHTVQIVSDILKKNDRAFVILQKVGTHFPYRANLPPDLAGVPDPYATSVKRSSVGFLTSLAQELPPSTLVFYTSDHGQNFHAKFTHCNFPGEISVSEWTVPLMVLYTADLQPVVDRIDPAWQDRVSHADMTEALRNLMGYQNPDVKSLLDPPGKPDLQHRAYYGPPHPFFGNHTFILIDKTRRAFLDDHTESAQSK